MTYTQAIESVSALSTSVGKAVEGGFKTGDKRDTVRALDQEIITAMQGMDDTDADAWPDLFGRALELARDCGNLGISRAVGWISSLSRLVTGEISGPARPPSSRAGASGTTGRRVAEGDPDATRTDAGRVWIPVTGIQPGQVEALQAWILDNGKADKVGNGLVKSWREGIEQEQARKALADRRRAATEAVTVPAPTETPSLTPPANDVDHDAAYLATVEERLSRQEQKTDLTLSILQGLAERLENLNAPARPARTRKVTPTPTPA